MPSENFDKKLKEAAEHQSSSGHEEAWEKMEILLNKHLPLKRKNRNFVLFLLLGLLLIGSGTYILVKRPFSPGSEASVTETSNTVKQPAVEPENRAIKQESSATVSDNEKNVPAGLDENKISKIPVAAVVQNNLNSGEKNTKVKNDMPGIEKQPATEKDKIIKTENISIQVSPTDQNNPVREEDQVADAIANDAPEQTKDDKQQKAQIEQKKKPVNAKKGFLSNLAFSLSAGPDLSFVEIHDAGRLRLSYGAGISYSVSKHFTIRSGFNVSRKIYTAEPADYNPPSYFWGYYPNLKSIDADCKIYDVPLIADYNFGKTQKWFASVGFSNLFMNRETYNYLYKPPTSQQYVTYSHTYNNENMHLFSVVSISGGYTKKISNSVSLHAEPYLRLPLQGIGHGKIKLGSGGVLFTASMKPFASKQDRKQ